MKQITNRVLRTSRIFGVLLVLCLILVPVSVHAGELAEQEVQAAVQTWVRHVTADARPDAFIERMKPYKVKGETVAYIAYLRGGGFCLCGADDLVLPVYLYNPQGTYAPQNPNCQYILWEIGTRLKNQQKRLEEKDSKLQPYQEALSERAAFWQDLIAGRISARMKGLETTPREPEMMELDLTCQWGMGWPYDDQCPVLTPPDENCEVGCVATAMAQIMYYWKWPNMGMGNADVKYIYHWTTDWIEEPLANDPQISTGWSDRLEWTSAGGGKLRMNGYWDKSLYEEAKLISNDPDPDHLDAYLANLSTLMTRLDMSWHTCTANFGATNYNWRIMKDTYGWPLGPGEAEMAKLCYHAGIAVEMNYGVMVSGAYLWDYGAPSDRCVIDALDNHFRYDEDAVYNPRFIDTMTEEIQWLRPILFEGRNSHSHAWIVYGYNKSTDPNRQFKMNLGRGLSSSAWYTCDEVDEPYDQAHVTRIAPEDVVRFVGDDYPGDGSPDSPHKDIEEALIKAPDGATLIFKAGSRNTFSTDPLVIDRPLTLKGYNIIIEKERVYQSTCGEGSVC